MSKATPKSKSSKTAKAGFSPKPVKTTVRLDDSSDSDSRSPIGRPHGKPKGRKGKKRDAGSRKNGIVSFK